MRRYLGEMNGEKFLGNLQTHEVHDLHNEKPSCQIQEIMKMKLEYAFNFLFEARNYGYENCKYCLGNSKK